MAKFSHRFASPKDMPANLEAIPGLVVDYPALAIHGSLDAIEAGGANVKDILALIHGNPDIVNTNDVEYLRHYQTVGAHWLYRTMKQHKGAILADDMGLGKTRTALYASTLVPNNFFTLVVAPASVAYQWQEEARLLGIPCEVLGAKAKSKDAWAKVAQGIRCYFVVSPNLAGEALATAPVPPNMLIFDEPHMYLRGRQGKWKDDIAEYIHLIPYRLACTGTPMYNTPRDLWTMLFLLFGMRFGKAKVFDARYCNGHQGTYGWVNDGASNLPELKKRLVHYMLRRTLEDVALELPPITTAFRWVKATAEAQAAMMQSHGSASGVDGALDKCLNAKVLETVQTALTLPEPCVIWTYHPHHATLIAQTLEESGKPCIPISGQMSVQERHLAIKQAQEKHISICATIDSCGTGVNMQGVASVAIFHSIQRIPKKTHQAMKRLHRSGQTNPVHNIFIAMKDAMDEIVVDTVIKKLDYWNDLMGKDDLETNVGVAVKPNVDTETAVLRAIYEEMNEG